MIRWRRLLVSLSLAASFTGCGREDANPFAANTSVARLRPTAAIVFVSDAYATRPSGLLEVFAVDADGSGMSRLTNCNTEARRCASVEVAPSFDGQRLAIRRILTDSDGNGRLGIGDTESLVVSDTARGVEGAITPRATGVTGVAAQAPQRYTGLDWSPVADILVYSAAGEGSGDDLYRTIPRPDNDGTQTRNLTFTAAVRERRPRIDPAGSVAAYERTDTGSKSEIWIFTTTTSQQRVTRGGDGSGSLGDLAVGGDSDPDYAPDGTRLVFRRLSGAGNGGLGTWDILSVRTDGTGLTTLATGPVYRSAPDWGPRGIVFSEIDRATNLARLVVIQADGASRVLLTLNGFDLQSPRWLPKP